MRDAFPFALFLRSELAAYKKLQFHTSSSMKTFLPTHHRAYFNCKYYYFFKANSGHGIYRGFIYLKFFFRNKEFRCTHPIIFGMLLARDAILNVDA